ncbi:fatty acid desaturase family protein [Gloeothece verrucosa]|uniref:Fatty acid desaturase n=1 Tax=Gloeothece verrucosa (strain PCC 7822) TaxID=497965 RepID=E0U9H2_GLOV7|nr:fatty acid desaturase family protein [Gloeothece verrucosa]ADN12664.1 fatty acid desaturase [Gloeothece verrucosa PCC 7822]
MLKSDLSVMDTVQEPETFDPVARQKTKHHQILSVQELNALNARSNWQGFLYLAGHLTIMGVSGYLWGTHLNRWEIGIPALVVYGFSFASMFAPMHECVHRTVFKNNRLNDLVGWFAGLLSFYNSTFYRRYHKWHHRYTRIPNKDPELTDLEPSNIWEYLLVMSGLLWWVDKLRGYFRMACGQFEGCPYVPEAAQKEVTRSIRLQLAVYGAGIAVSLFVGQPWFFLYWLLPLAVGQPFLRFILLAEHTGCTKDDNHLSNTRTTLTFWPIRFLMWNMPFHAEHHLYPSIPFHALPAAHQKLREHFTHVEPGYLKVNRQIIETFREHQST